MRFLRYEDRERVMALRSKFSEDPVYGVNQDLPREFSAIRRRLTPILRQARERGQTARFSKTEPQKLYIDGVEYKG